jgi:hypothetical protein
MPRGKMQITTTEVGTVRQRRALCPKRKRRDPYLPY